MSTEFQPVQIFSSGVLVSAAESSVSASLASGGNDSMFVLSGGVAVETDIAEGGLLVADSGALISGININADGAVFSGTDVICSANSKWYGPAICATNGTVVLSGGTFTSNHAFASGGYDGQGGAIETYYASLTIEGGVYSFNSATGGGGAILVINDSASVTGAEFLRNRAKYGGAIEMSQQWGGTGNITVSGCVFTSNRADFGGGFENHAGASALIADTIFTGNSATSGGAVLNDFYDASKSEMTVTGGEFTGNAAEEGGAIYNAGDLAVTGGSFTGNTAYDGKGGALFNARSASVTGAQFTGNEAMMGGAVWQTGAKLDLAGAAFTSNTAIYGGALYANGSGAVVVSGGNFAGNSACYDEDYEMGGMGGALYVTAATTVTVENTVFNGNFSEVNPDNEWDGGCGGAVINYGSFTVTGGNFTANSAYYGAGLYNQAGEGNPMTVTGVDFTGNSATYGGGAICNCWGELVVSGGSFTGNTVKNSDGGAIANWSVAAIADAEFADNEAKQGGAISNSWAQSITVTDCTFSGNTADQGGAFIQMNGGTADFTDCVFTENAAEEGGAIWNDGVLTVTGGSFASNVAEEGKGGAFFNAGSGAVTGASFAENEAMMGGAVWQTGDELALDGATFTSNTAIYGGALYANGSGAVVVSGGNFAGNSACYDEDYEMGGMGGALYVTAAATVTVENTVFNGNFSEVNPDNEWDGGCGGAVINYGSFTVTGGEFTANRAYYGAGLYNQAGAGKPMTVTDVDFTGNSATYGGGAICNCWGELVVSGGSFTGNTVENSDGGAIANWSAAEVAGAVFTDNEAVKGGAISNSWAQSITVTDCTFSGNTADQGGAFIQMNGGTAAFVNCTFSGNTADQGGAIWNDAALTLDGCTFSSATDTIWNAGVITVSSATTFNAEVANGESGVFTVALAGKDMAAVVNGWSFISGGSVGISVASGAADGSYNVASGVGSWSGDIALVVGGEDTGFAFSVENGEVISEAVIYDGIEYALGVSAGAMTLVTEAKPVPTGLHGDADGVSWNPMSGDAGYVLELSQDGFSTSIAIDVAGTQLEFLTIWEGNYSWRVRSEEHEEWAVGKEISAPERTAGPMAVEAKADGVSDVFFADATSVWSRGYLARNMGSVGGWTGTAELADLAGRNRFEDLFKGADDANVMYLTDDGNGDALFLDDIYSYSGSEARMANIEEIRCGAGDDVVDLTSQRYALVLNGDGIALRGGTGDDILWGNSGVNLLFGDAGNDKLVGGTGDDLLVGGSGDDVLNGGGGNDIFAFGGEWGADQVIQRAGGKVTLWFDAGDLSNWDAATLTYTDGGKSVTVSGATAADVTLKFGDDGSERYSEMAELGAFMEESTASIFDMDDPSKRVLASL